MRSGPSATRRDHGPKAKAAPFKGLLFVVSRDAMDKYQSLKRIFADDERVMVILDRRTGERRKTTRPRPVERRRSNRRSRPAVEERLVLQGWAMVRLEAPVPRQLRTTADPVKAILVVDDDPNCGRLLEDILTADGYQVATARNGVEALLVLAVQVFDLLLVDIRMPELDGPDFFHELARRNPAHARRVMFMTGGAVGAETAALLSTVRTPLLRKPFAAQEVRAAVERFFLAADGFRRQA